MRDAANVMRWTSYQQSAFFFFGGTILNVDCTLQNCARFYEPQSNETCVFCFGGTILCIFLHATQKLGASIYNTYLNQNVHHLFCRGGGGGDRRHICASEGRQ